MASLRLRTEPTVRQVDVILACVEGALGARAARVTRGARGEVRFRMPPPWQARGAGLLRLVSGGEVNVIAGWGEPRRLRYLLRFIPLYVLGALVTVAILVAGWNGPSRLSLLLWVLELWGVVLLLRLVVARQMRELLAVCARDIIERRADDGGEGANGPDEPGPA